MGIFQNGGMLYGFKTECCNHDIKIHCHGLPGDFPVGFYKGVFQFTSEINSLIIKIKIINPI